MKGGETMKRTTSIMIDAELFKEAKIKCINEDITFPRYLEALIKADLEKDKKGKTNY